MAENKKNILVIAENNKAEALRMASGLTLLDDAVSVDVCGPLQVDAAVQEQLDALEFAEVPIRQVNPMSADGMEQLAKDILDANVVYVI